MKRIWFFISAMVFVIACALIFFFNNKNASREEASVKVEKHEVSNTKLIKVPTINDDLNPSDFSNNLQADLKAEPSSNIIQDESEEEIEIDNSESEIEEQIQEIQEDNLDDVQEFCEEYIAEEYENTDESVEYEEQIEDEYSADYEYLGDWTITAYCPCGICCGQYATGYTASGTLATSNHTVACGILPFGTQIMIDGVVYTVEDTGVYGEWIDIFFDSHDEALAYGMQAKSVYILR